MKMKEIRESSVKELQEELNALHRELFNLRMQRGMEGVSKPHLFLKARRNIARIKTVINENRLRNSHESD